MTNSYAAGRRPGRFRVNFYPPLTSPVRGAQLGHIDLNPDIVKAQWSSQWDVGFQSLNVQYERLIDVWLGREPHRFAHLQQSGFIPDFAHVEVTEGSRTVWEGRLMLPEEPEGRLRQFTADGYGSTALQDGVFEWPTTDTTQATSGEILRTAITAQAPILAIGTPTQFVDPGVLHQWAKFNLQTPAQIAQTVFNEGDSQGRQLFMGVYEGRVFTCQPQEPPARADYQIDFTPDLTWKTDLHGTYGAIILVYSGGTQSPYRKTQPGFADRHGGVMRTAVVQGNTMDDASAAAFAQTWLNTHAAANIASTITVGGTADGASVDGLRRKKGGSTAPWFVRPAQWVEVGDQGLLPIARVQFDAGTLIATVDLGQPAFGWDLRIQKTMQAAAHYAAGTNPVTGTPVA